MSRFAGCIASPLSLAALCTLAVFPSAAQVSVRSVKVLGQKDVVEIEVAASDRIVPQTRILTGPDRLVIDFPNTVPSSQIRSQSIDRGDVKDVRVGLFQAKPPVTRLVLDLKAPRSFQVFPYGRTVMIKVIGDSGAADATAYEEPAAQPHRPGLVVANYTTGTEQVRLESPVQPALQVSYHEGLLGINANKATLSEVLYAVQQRTGADISIPSGAEQEKVVAEIEPAPAAEVLARLLNGSRFNFLILNAAGDPRKLDRVILSMRSGGGFVPPPPPVEAKQEDAVEEEPAYIRDRPNAVPPPVQVPKPEADAESKISADDTPDQ